MLLQWQSDKKRKQSGVKLFLEELYSMENRKLRLGVQRGWLKCTGWFRRAQLGAAERCSQGKVGRRKARGKKGTCADWLLDACFLSP